VLRKDSLNSFVAAVIGIIAAVVVAFITHYYTSYKKRPIQDIAFSAEGGPAPGIVTDLSVGMESTGLFIVVIACALFFAFVAVRH